MIKIGNCPDSWGVWYPQDDKQPDWHTYLDEVSQAGFKYTEIGPYGYMSTDPTELKAELDKRGLVPIAATLMFDIEDDSQMEAVTNTTHTACSLLKAIGAQYYIIMDLDYKSSLTGQLRLPAQLSEEAFDKLCSNYRTLCGIVRSYGLVPVYHPHCNSHVETEAQIEAMIRKIPKEELRFCLDTGHHISIEGNDLFSFTEKIADQIEYLHFKDLAVGTDYASWKFVELGAGQIDWIEYTQLLKKINFNGYAVIELDCYPAVPGESLQTQTRIGNYLNNINCGSRT